MTAVPIELTRITKAGGKVTKKLHLSPEGKFTNDSRDCRISRGRMQRLVLPDWRQIAAIIEFTPDNGAFALGVLQPELPTAVRLVPKRNPKSATPGYAPRTGARSL